MLNPKLPSLLCTEQKRHSKRAKVGKEFPPVFPPHPHMCGAGRRWKDQQFSVGRKDRSSPGVQQGSPPCCQHPLRPSEPRGQVWEGRPCPPAAMPTHAPLPEPQFPILQHHLQQEEGKHLLQAAASRAGPEGPAVPARSKTATDGRFGSGVGSHSICHPRKTPAQPSSGIVCGI